MVELVLHVNDSGNSTSQNYYASQMNATPTLNANTGQMSQWISIVQIETIKTTQKIWVTT